MVSTGMWKWASRCSRSWWSQEERWWGGTSRMISSTGSLKRVSSIASIGSWRTETEPITGACGGQLELRQRRAEDGLGLGRLVVALGVQQVQLGSGRVQHDQPELHVAVLGAVPDGVAQATGWARRCRSRPGRGGFGCSDMVVSSDLVGDGGPLLGAVRRPRCGPCRSRSGRPRPPGSCRGTARWCPRVPRPRPPSARGEAR